MNKITLYKVHRDEPRTFVKPASQSREWMEYANRFAYKCLPLAIANQHGWVIYTDKKVCAEWNGGPNVDDIRVMSPSGVATSHFGNGVLTFTVDYLFSLPEGYSLYITGPTNSPKKGIMPLTGIYEADWAPYSFTMNWKFIDAHQTVVFEENEPFCFVFPIQRNLIESFTLEHRQLDENQDLYDQYSVWGKERNAFNANTNRPESDWQKHYFKGIYPDGTKCPYDHKTKLKLD